MERVRVSEVLLRVSQLAAGQWGLLTAAQAEREQVPRYRLARLADAGLLERLDHGVYAVAGSDADEHRRVRAAWLALDSEHTAEERLTDMAGSGVVSHTSAAGLYGLGDLLDDIPELTTTTRKQSRRGVRLHRADLPAEDVTLVDGLPTTTMERTVADLLRDGHDVDHVASIVGEGVRRGMVDRGRLATHLEPLARRHGRTDGHDLAEHLLDITGLSTKALARQVASSPIGQELVTAGALSTMERVLAAMSTVDMSKYAAITDWAAGPQMTALMDKLDVISRVGQPALEQWATIINKVPPITVPSWLANLNVPASAPRDEQNDEDESA